MSVAGREERLSLGTRPLTLIAAQSMLHEMPFILLTSKWKLTLQFPAGSVARSVPWLLRSVTGPKATTGISQVHRVSMLWELTQWSRNTSTCMCYAAARPTQINRMIIHLFPSLNPNSLTILGSFCTTVQEVPLLEYKYKYYKYNIVCLFFQLSLCLDTRPANIYTNCQNTS